MGNKHIVTGLVDANISIGTLRFGRCAEEASLSVYLKIIKNTACPRVYC
jgi:hypothetical protein